KAGSNTCAGPALPDLAAPAAGAALAVVAWETIGAATAVTADAERNARRVEPRWRGTSLFSIQRIFGGFKIKSSQMCNLVDISLLSVVRRNARSTQKGRKRE